MSISYRDDIYLAIRTIRFAKTRSLLTVLGIIIGIVSVVSIVSISKGIESQVEGQINATGKGLIIVKPGVITKTSSNSIINNLSSLSSFNSISSLTPSDIKSVQATSGVESSSAVNIVNGQVITQNGKFSEVVMGTGYQFPSVINQQLSDGEYFDPYSDNIYQAVIGQNLAQKLFGEKVPLGLSFDFHGQTFIVRGIFKQFKSAPLTTSSDINNTIFIPYTTAEGLTNNSAPIYEILAKANNINNVDQITNSINKNLLKLHGGQQDFTVLKQSQSLALTTSVLDSLTYLVGIVAAIALVVGGVGIMNISLVSVSERTKEIGIRKAIGATNSQILSQFLIESSVLSLFGGLMGVVLSFSVDYVLSITTSLAPVIDLPTLGVAFLISLAVGIIFGSLPAFKAARKDPIKALRYE
jgi:putative ABC transport system permease protein